MPDKTQDNSPFAKPAVVGISPKADGESRLSAMNTSVELFQKVQMINLIAPLILANRLLEPLKLAQGAIVNVTSIAGSQIPRLPDLARNRQNR